MSGAPHPGSRSRNGPGAPVQMRPRLLLVEDDATRVARFREWLQGTEFVLVHVQSGGQALGLLSRGCDGIAGVLLDHDLSDSPLTSVDMTMSTSELLPTLCRRLPKSAPVLIHSHNVSKPVHMQRALESAGLSVTRARFALLEQDPQRLRAWLDEVRDNWDDGA